ncbi:MAG: prenyltransferase [Alphaproteobacteria bacterium]
MKPIYLTRQAVEAGFFDGAHRRICDLQGADGSIAWYDHGVIDPWNHTEAAMALSILGDRGAAERAYAFLRDSQLADGSWWAQYGAAVPMDGEKYVGDGQSEKRLRDTNFCAYPATGVWHHYLVTGDRGFLTACWPMIRGAMEFVLGLQTEHGDIRWAADDEGTPEDDALITGCSSIHKSLWCAYRISQEVGQPRDDWVEARRRLAEALTQKPDRFDRQWESKSRYSMDWYYPVLGQVIEGPAAQQRLAARWDDFVVDGLGCRCVSDQPWVTIAESCELVLTLLAMGERQRAAELYACQHKWRDSDGAYWMGYQFHDEVAWPAEKPAWTAAAVILAADALLGLTNAAGLFTGRDGESAPPAR